MSVKDVLQIQEKLSGIKKLDGEILSGEIAKLQEIAKTLEEISKLPRMERMEREKTFFGDVLVGNETGGGAMKIISPRSWNFS